MHICYSTHSLTVPYSWSLIHSRFLTYCVSYLSIHSFTSSLSHSLNSSHSHFLCYPYIYFSTHSFIQLHRHTLLLYLYLIPSLIHTDFSLNHSFSLLSIYQLFHSVIHSATYDLAQPLKFTYSITFHSLGYLHNYTLIHQHLLCHYPSTHIHTHTLAYIFLS